MIRVLMTASAAALMLAACAPNRVADPAGGSAEEIAAPASLPLSLGSPAIEIRNDTFGGLAVADPQIAAFDPALAERLMAQAREALEEMDAAAARDQAEWAAQEAEAPQGWELRPYEMEIRYRATAAGFGHLSVRQDVYVNSGGAHPNYALGGAVYAAGESQPVPISAIIAQPATFGAALKARLVNMKIERGYGEEDRAYLTGEVEDILGDDMSAGADWAENFVLQASTEEGLFGGLTVLFSPYDVGPYAEGSYEITFTAEDLAGLLTPDWAPRFGGAPVIPAEGP